MDAPWGPWRPDVGGPNSGFAQTADSVIPMRAATGGVGYRPFPKLVIPTSATALSGAPRGIISVVKSDGSWQVFAATASTIEQLQSDYTWSSIETGRTVTSGDDVSFVKYGSFLLNTDTTDGFKAYSIEAPAGNNTVSGAPTARFVFSSNNVVFALDCDGNNRRLQNCALGDYTNWRTGGADGKTLEDGGALLWGCDLKNGKAFVLQDSVSRIIDFTAAPDNALYGIYKAANGRGSVGARSCVDFDGMVFYLSSDDFYRFDLTNGNVPIGGEKIARWFFDKVATADYPNVQAALDPFNKIVLWTIPGTGQLLGYHWQLQEWFTVTVSISALARIQTPGYTLDSMDSFGKLDDLTLSLDDRFWQGGAPLFGALNDSYVFGTFSGAAMAATLETCLFNNPTTGLVGWATQITDSANASLYLGTSDNLSDATTWGSAATKGRSGRTPLRGRGMNIAFKQTIPDSETWTYSNGVDHIQRSQGGPV